MSTQDNNPRIVKQPGKGRVVWDRLSSRSNDPPQAEKSLSHRATDLTLDNGVSGDGHFQVQLDEYGSFGEFNGTAWNDRFDPSPDPLEGELGELQQGATFATQIRIFTGPTGAGGRGNRVAPSAHPDINEGYNQGGFADADGGATLDFEIISPNSTDNLPTSTSSVFRVFRDDQGIDLKFEVTQTVGVADSGPNGETAAKLEQTYRITNMGDSTLEFRLNKHIDEDMPWGTNGGGAYWLDDLVGMNSAELDRPQVFAQDRQLTTAALILRTREDMAADPRTTEFVYYAAKENTPNPDPGDARCPDFGLGTFITPIWNNFGVPECYKNVVGGVGHNVPGTSPQVTGDSYIGLQLSIRLGVGEFYTVTFETIYGFRPLPTTTLPPALETKTIRFNADGCAEFLWSLRNINPVIIGQQPLPVEIFYIDVEAGDGARLPFPCVQMVPPAGWDAELCAGFDVHGHALYKFTGGVPIERRDQVHGRLIVDTNGSAESTNEVTGVVVPPLSVLLHAAQEQEDAVCGFDFGPQDQGDWNVGVLATAFLPVPSLSDWAKTILAALMACGGTLVLRSGRRSSHPDTGR
ncbi:MAG: hypothetical protein V3W34_00530 [Phycisphaerae bacterium]